MSDFLIILSAVIFLCFINDDVRDFVTWFGCAVLGLVLYFIAALFVCVMFIIYDVKEWFK